MIELLRRALSSPCGIAVRTDNPELCKAKLYAARAEDGDPALWRVSITRSPENPETEIWIVRKNPDDPQEG